MDTSVEPDLTPGVPAGHPAWTALASVARRELARARVPGLSLVVVRRRGPVFAAGFGTADLATGAPATARTGYLWFSMSKIATATAAMVLADDGRLDLDAPVSEYLPEPPLGTPAARPRVRQLLSHTAGVGNPPPLRWVRPAGAAPPDPAAFLAPTLGRGRRRHAYPVGGPARYSNLGYLVLGQVIAAAAGQPFERFVTDAVLVPAGMTGTGYTRRPDVPHATGYVRASRAMSPLLRAALPAGIVDGRQGRYVGFRPFLVNGAAYGGLVGGALDAARLAALHLGDGEIDGTRVLSPASAVAMRTIAHPGRPFDLGLGWFRPPGDRDARPAFVEHYGSGGGFWNAMRIYPDLDLGVVMMANTTRRYDIGALCAAAVAAPWP